MTDLNETIKELTPWQVGGIMLIGFSLIVIASLVFFQQPVTITNQTISSVLNERMEIIFLWDTIIICMMFRLFINYGWDQYLDKPQGRLSS